MESIGRLSISYRTLLPVTIRALHSSTVCSRSNKIVIVGGGSGGIAVASRLASALDAKEVTVIEPSEVHYYQPLWTLVGAGIGTLKGSSKSTQSIMPRGVSWIKDNVTKFEPEKSELQLAGGGKVAYDHLVLAMGMELRFDKIPGALNALQTDRRVLSNYSVTHVDKTWQAYQAFKGGRAIFTLPVGPIKCAGAPQKVMYLFEHYLRKQGLRDSADIQYFTSLPKMFSVDKYAERLAAICRERDIHFHLRHHLVEVNSAKSEVTVENLETNEKQTMQYDLLHITPPMAPSAVLVATPHLTDPKGADYVAVDASSLRHKHYDNIWALGDCSNLPTSKTAAAVSSQAATLSKNLISVIKGGPANVAIYDGYTACPLVTGYNRGMLAEFDYTLVPLETFPLDQGTERYLYYFLKAKLMPSLYWDWLLRGIWSGPKRIRKLLHLGMSK